jgi:ribosomal protein S18 acetylase RimI-like enzyme
VDAVIRRFRAGEGPAIAQAWSRAAPADPISYPRFRDLILLDRNFDPAGLLVAESGGQLVGAAYGVRRRIATTGTDLEPGVGWLLFFFVVPEARGAGIGRGLVTAVMDWLGSVGARTVDYSSYSPNYVLPGLDEQRYPSAARLLAGLGFAVVDRAEAMDRDLAGYVMPEAVRARLDDLVRQGWWFGAPVGDDLVELVELAGGFSWDWARVLRETALAGSPAHRVIAARHPAGQLLGWAATGSYDNLIERFGPFGVLPAQRGQGVGEILLHLALTQIRALGGHSAWFLWVEEDSAANALYRKAGFRVTRRFTIRRAKLAEPALASERQDNDEPEKGAP